MSDNVNSLEDQVQLQQRRRSRDDDYRGPIHIASAYGSGMTRCGVRIMRILSTIFWNGNASEATCRECLDQYLDNGQSAWGRRRGRR